MPQMATGTYPVSIPSLEDMYPELSALLANSGSVKQKPLEMHSISMQHIMQRRLPYIWKLSLVSQSNYCYF
jgi:hypothetical protein